MAQVVQATCPGCKAALRIPTELLAQPVRCQACGTMMRMRPPESARPTTPALPVAPTPPPPPRPKSATDASPFAFDLEDEAPAPIRKRRARRSRGWLGIVAAFVILALTAGGSYKIYTEVLIPRERAAKGGDEDQEPAATGGKQAAGKNVGFDEPVAAPFPRRALLISVHNYLFANPIPEGPADSPNVDRLGRSLSLALRIPPSQIVHLSDAAKEPRPPLKSVVEKAITDFLKSTRKQDRVLLVFAGHTKEIDNVAYLVPLEGELDNAQTLIPLDWVFKQLAGCDCRQKVLVLDGNRFNAAQGLERPASGPMGAKFEAALRAPPAGVQVWSACSAGQQSHEFEESPLGLFLDSLRLALTPEKGKKGVLEGNIQKPDDLFPLEEIQATIQERLTSVLARRKLGKQSAFLAGKPSTSGADYDRAEKPAAALVLPTVNQSDPKLVKAILDEISLPPIKGGESMSLDVSPALLPPFSPDVLHKYDGADLPANSKLRKAIHKARVTLWGVSPSKDLPAELAADVGEFRSRLKVNSSSMRDRFGRPGGGEAEVGFKKGLYDSLREVAQIQARLENVLDDLKEAGDEKESAPPRWKAHYDFLLARLQSQLAYVEEYEGLLGQMRRELPPHDPDLHAGFRMASREKLGDTVGKKFEKAARKIYDDLAKGHPKTPWEVLAKREKLTALGLEWQAY